MQHEGKGDPRSALLLGRRRVSRARRGGCRSWGFCWRIGSHDGEGGPCVARAVTINVPGLSAVEAKVVAASTIAFGEGNMAIRREPCRGVARGGRRVRSPIVVVTAARAFSRIVVPTVPWLGVAFRRGREASL